MHAYVAYGLGSISFPESGVVVVWTMDVPSSRILSRRKIARSISVSGRSAPGPPAAWKG
jgi:hypothetical protein